MKISFESIILFVKNVERLKQFYIDNFNLVLLEETAGEWVLLKAGHSNIALHKIGDQYLNESATEFKVESNTKMVFEVDGDLHALRQLLLDKRVAVREIKTFDNYDFWLCDGEDPEGNVFQLKQKK